MQVAPRGLKFIMRMYSQDYFLSEMEYFEEKKLKKNRFCGVEICVRVEIIIAVFDPKFRIDAKCLVRFQMAQSKYYI
jgi:hypothetical protein